MSSEQRLLAQKLASRPYTIRILRDDSIPEKPLYMAVNPELEGCMAQGESIEEAERFLDEFRVDYILHLLEHDLPVPEPAATATMTSTPIFVTETWPQSTQSDDQNDDATHLFETTIKT